MEIVAVDIIDAPLRVLAQKASDLENVSVLKCEIGVLPFQDGFFSGSITVNSIYHGLPHEVQKTLDEVERVLEH